MSSASAGVRGAVFLGIFLAATAEPVRGAGDTRLIDAVRGRDAKAVAALLKQRVDVNAPQPDGATPLHWAAHLDDVITAELLLRAGAQPNAANDYGVTPLVLAAQNGSVRMIEGLLQVGADPNVVLPSGETALMTAARTGDPDAVKALLARGADPNGRERAKGQTALMWALAEQHVGAARALIEHGADVHAPSKSGFTPLMFAVRFGNLDAVRMLLDRGADINAAAADGTSALLVATVRGHIELAKFLLEKGADPNDNRAGYTALHYVSGKWEGVDAHDYPDAPGEWRVLRGIPPAHKADLIRALFAHRVNPNVRASKAPPLYGFSLVAGGIRRIMSQGATPFFVAAMSADVDVMRLLVAGGADPMIGIRDGSTPLLVAAGMQWLENETAVTEDEYLAAIAFCLEIGLDVNGANNAGNTALHVTIPAGFDRIVEFLAAKGADVNVKNKKGDTPLSVATLYFAAGGTHTRESTAALLRKLGAVEAKGQADGVDPPVNVDTQAN